MNKKSLLFTLLSFVVLTSSAQETDTIKDVVTISNPTLSYTSTSFEHNQNTLNNVLEPQSMQGRHNRLMLDFQYNSNSNLLPQQMAWSLLFNGPINDKLKDRALGRIKSKVKYEDELRAGISYSYYLPKKNIGVYFNYNHRNYRNLFFGKEAYELVFYGNSRFEDDTVDMSGIRFQNFIYHQYTGGFTKQFDYGNFQIDVGVGVSFLQGITQQEIRTDTAWIYTAPDGEFIDAKYNLTFNACPDGAAKATKMQGGGASAELVLAFQQRNNWRLGIELSDVGAMYFRKNTVNYSGNNYVRFQGITLPDLLNFSAQTFDSLNIPDSVKALLPSKSANDYRLFLPFTGNVYFSKTFMKNRLVVTAGLRYKFIKQYNVYGYIKANYFHKGNVISASIGTGGYSYFNLGFEYARKWKYFDFAIGSANLLGTLVPTHMPGASVYLRLGTTF